MEGLDLYIPIFPFEYLKDSYIAHLLFRIEIRLSVKLGAT